MSEPYDEYGHESYGYDDPTAAEWRRSACHRVDRVVDMARPGP